MTQGDLLRYVAEALEALGIEYMIGGSQASTYYVVADAAAPDDRLLRDLHVLLHARFGVDHTTIQVEREAPPLVQITAAPRPQ